MKDTCEIAARLIRELVESWKLPPTPLNAAPELWWNSNIDTGITDNGETFESSYAIVGYDEAADEVILKTEFPSSRAGEIRREPVEDFEGLVQELVATAALPPFFIRDAVGDALTEAGFDPDDYDEATNDARFRAEECAFEEFESAVEDAGWIPFPVTESGDGSDVIISAGVDPRTAHNALRELLVLMFEEAPGMGRISPHRNRRRHIRTRRHRF